MISLVAALLHLVLQSENEAIEDYSKSSRIVSHPLSFSTVRFKHPLLFLLFFFFSSINYMVSDNSRGKKGDDDFFQKTGEKDQQKKSYFIVPYSSKIEI